MRGGGKKILKILWSSFIDGPQRWRRPLPRPSRSSTTLLTRRSLAPRAGRRSTRAKLARRTSTLSRFASGFRDDGGSKNKIVSLKSATDERSGLPWLIFENYTKIMAPQTSLVPCTVCKLGRQWWRVSGARGAHQHWRRQGAPLPRPWRRD